MDMANLLKLPDKVRLSVSLSDVEVMCVRRARERRTDLYARLPLQFYYLFGFLFVVFIILIITCAEITIVLCYFQLCSEDYNWW